MRGLKTAIEQNQSQRQTAQRVTDLSIHEAAQSRLTSNHPHEKEQHQNRQSNPGRQFAGKDAGKDQNTSGQKDRKSTRLNSSHVAISYAVFCLKKKTTSLVTHLIHTFMHL